MTRISLERDLTHIVTAQNDTISLERDLTHIVTAQNDTHQFGT